MTDIHFLWFVYYVRKRYVVCSYLCHFFAYNSAKTLVLERANSEAWRYSHWSRRGIMVLSQVLGAYSFGFYNQIQKQSRKCMYGYIQPWQIQTVSPFMSMWRILVRPPSKGVIIWCWNVSHASKQKKTLWERMKPKVRKEFQKIHKDSVDSVALTTCRGFFLLLKKTHLDPRYDWIWEDNRRKSLVTWFNQRESSPFNWPQWGKSTRRAPHWKALVRPTKRPWRSCQRC